MPVFYRIERVDREFRLMSHPVTHCNNRTFDGQVQIGVWLDTSDPEYPREKTTVFVHQDDPRPFAHPTIEGARAAFITMNKRKIRKLEASIQRAREAIAWGESADLDPGREP